MSDSRHLVLVTGATGALGPCVVSALSEAGYRIRVLSRIPPRQGVLPDTVEVHIGDISDAQAVQAAAENCDAVMHMAALLHIANPSPAVRSEYERVNVQGTQLIVEAAHTAGAKRLVFFSTIAIYGSGGGPVLNEDCPPKPNTFYAETKLDGEQIVLAARREDGQPLGIVLRLGAVYGAHVKGNYRRLVRSLTRGQFVPVGNGANRRTLVYEKDVASAALLALQHPAAISKIYNVTDGQFHSVAEINHAICEAIGRKPPRFSIPIGPVRQVAGLIENVAGLVGLQSPINRATIDKYTEDVMVSGQRIQDELGFQPEYDLYTGWQEAVREMRDRGELPV